MPSRAWRSRGAALLVLACGRVAPPLACPDGARLQRVEYAERDGGGYGERCVRPDGTRDGPSRDWYGDGTLRSLTHWMNGERHGRSTLWHPNGAKQAEIQHSHWAPVGLWTNWDENGNVIDRHDFGGGADARATDPVSAAAHEPRGERP